MSRRRCLGVMIGTYLGICVRIDKHTAGPPVDIHLPSKYKKSILGIRDEAFARRSVFVARSTKTREKCRRVPVIHGGKCLDHFFRVDALHRRSQARKMSFTIRQIKPSWSELIVIPKSSVLFGPLVADITSMRLGDYGNCPSVI
ncbi:hypothetical protein ACTXT7_013231 [Hymenolepis weldensis]